MASAAAESEAQQPLPPASLDASHEPLRNALCFVVDSTGSMGSWLTALAESLHDVIDTALLTGAFDAVGVLAYGDYDCTWPRVPIEWSGWTDVATADAKQVRALHAFTKQLTPRDGGGRPEAFKTAMWKVLRVAPPRTRLHIVCMTDAPMHGPEGALDKEGLKEKDVLGERFPFGVLARAILARGDVRFSAICSCPLSLAPLALLAQATGGDAQLIAQVDSPAYIRAALQATVSAWMGAADAPIVTHTMSEVPTDAAVPAAAAALLGPAPIAPPFAHEVPEPLQPWYPLLRLSDGSLPRACDGTGAVALRPELAGPLQTAVSRMKSDEAFVDRVCVTLRLVCAESPMALCGNAVLGRLWRAFCARRRDPRRDEFLRLLDVAKRGLSGEDALRFAQWNTQSHDATSEIRADLRDFAAANGVQGLIRYSGGDDGFVPQSINEVFLSVSRDGLRQVAQFLARLSVDEDYAIAAPPPAASAAAAIEEDASAPMPWTDDAALPLNLPLPELFAMLLHVAVPGVALSRRAGLILAAIAYDHGAVVKPQAAAYLEKARGRGWVTWERRPDGTPLVPENFGAGFLALLLRVPPALTEEECAIAAFTLQVAHLLRAPRVELIGQFPDPHSADGCLPDHVDTCALCHEMRPLSLIAADGICGYCKDHRTYASRSAAPAACAAASSKAGKAPAPHGVDRGSVFQVRCDGCGGYYSRDRAALMNGATSRCYYCRRGPKPHTVACSKCHVLVVAPTLSLPGGVCGPCAAGRKPRVPAVADRPVAARHAFPLDTVWRELYAAVGLEADAPVQVPLPQAVLLLLTPNKAFVVALCAIVFPSVAELFFFFFQIGFFSGCPLPQRGQRRSSRCRRLRLMRATSLCATPYVLLSTRLGRWDRG
jgi:hypothetical protein